MTIEDLYITLFGKEHITDASVIEMAEHGRQGGVSTGTPFKSIQEVPNEERIDIVDENTIYIGEAKPGTSTGLSNWRITKFVKSGDAISLKFPSGNDSFNFEWDERTSYTY